MRAILLFIIIIYSLSCTTSVNKNSIDFKTLTNDTLDLVIGEGLCTMLNLHQIQKGVDSFELRFWNLGSPNELIILRYLDYKWITCNYSYQTNRRNIVVSQSVLCQEIRPQVAVSIVNYFSQDSILKIPSQNLIPNFKDTSIEEGGCTYLIEIATKDFYKNLLYNNPHVHADFYNKQFIRIIKFLETHFKLLPRFEAALGMKRFAFVGHLAIT